MDFVAIDFETATSDRNSACSVGIVVVSDGKIVDEYYSLIKPPGNYYDWRTIRVHGIKPKQTESAPKFAKVYPQLKKRMAGNIEIGRAHV